MGEGSTQQRNVTQQRAWPGSLHGARHVGWSGKTGTICSGDSDTGSKLPAHKSDRISFQDIIGKQNVDTARMKNKSLLGFPKAPHTYIHDCPPHTETLVSRRRDAPPKLIPLTLSVSLSYAFIQHTFIEHTFYGIHHHTHDPRAWHSVRGTAGAEWRALWRTQGGK